jgi:RHS repeat-associated protein
MVHLSGAVPEPKYAPNGVHLTLFSVFPNQQPLTVGGTTCDFPATTCTNDIAIDGCTLAPRYTMAVAPCHTTQGNQAIEPIVDLQPAIETFDAGSRQAKLRVTFPHQGRAGILPRVRLNWAPSNDIAASGFGSSNLPTFDPHGNLIQTYDPSFPPPEGTVGVFATAFACGNLIDVSYAPLPDKDTGCDGSAAANCDSCDKGCVGDPIRTSNGNVRYTETDPLPSNPAFRLVRVYDSNSPSSGVFGTHWTSTFDTRAYTINLSSGSALDTHRAVFLRTERNQQVAFERRTTAQPYRQIWPRNQLAQGKLSFDGTSYVYEADAEGVVRTYDATTGVITGYRSVSDGQGVTIAWQGGFPTSVTDNRGNWTLSIANDGIVISGVGVIGQPSLQWTYRHSGSQLVSVEDAASNVWRGYEYDLSSLLTRVTDARGALIESHQYDAAGKGATSSGPSGEVTSVVYNPSDRTPRSDDETITSVTYGSNYRADYYMRPIAGRLRVVTINGPCSSCDMNDVVDTYDEKGNVVREQDGRGYITNFTYDQTGSTLIQISGPWRPAACDPATDALQCRLTPDDLFSAPVVATTATKTTGYSYVDPNWPSRATHIASTSVLQPSALKQVSTTYDAVSGEALVRSSTGFTGQDGQIEQTRTSTVSLYNGVETAAFSPGGTFDPSWETKPQPLGTRKSVDGPRTDLTDVTKYVYYPVDAAVPSVLRGRLAAVRNAAGHVIRMENYDVFGHATRVVDANGVATEATYDALGRPLSSTVKALPTCDTIADPLCATDLTSSNTYLPATGPLSTSVRPAGGVTTYGYDVRGRIANMARGASTAALAERIEYDYDPTNDLKSQERYLDTTSVTPVEKRRESYAYDSSNRLATVTHADNSTVAYTYDGSGKLLTIRDERHALPNTTNAYDPAGRLSKVTQVLSSAPGGTINTQYGYDIDGNLTAVTDPNGNVTSYVYDDFGQMIKQVSPVTGTTTYAYDLAGNLALATDANGATTTRTYDLLNRVSAAISTCGENETVTWTYDASVSGQNGVGRVATMIDPSGSTSYAYDRRGLLRREDQMIGSWSTSTAYQYDADGNRAVLGNLQYTYDYAGRPLTVSRRGCPTCTPDFIVASTAYLPFGPETDLLFGNGTHQTKAYDSRYRISENMLTAPGSLTLADHVYTIDPAGNITVIQDSLNAAFNRLFGYDDLNRLVSANTGSSLWGTGSYSYDSMGNLLSLQVGDRTESFTYAGTTPKIVSSNTLGQYSQVSYDAAGNETHSTYVYPPLIQGPPPLLHVNRVIPVGRAYSCRNLLAKTWTGPDPCSSFHNCGPRDPRPTTIYKYTYDGRGVRAHVSDGEKRDYLYTPELQLRLYRNPDAEQQDEYVWFNGHPVAQFASYSASLLYTFTDHLGTPLIQTSATAAIVWQADYDPYGRIFHLRIGDEFDQPLRLPGQDIAAQNDSGAEENYNIFRWYRPGWGRYTQADPVGLAGGINAFSYVNDNPQSFVDPLGLVCAISVWSEDATYDFSPSNWTSAFKHTWGHRWIEYPGGSAGFWPMVRPSDPISGVPGRVQSPDPNSKVAHTSFMNSETFFQQTPQRCVDCQKATKCVADFARTYTCDYSLGRNNCRDFVDQALGACGLTTQSPTDYRSNRK